MKTEYTKMFIFFSVPVCLFVHRTLQEDISSNGNGCDGVNIRKVLPTGGESTPIFVSDCTIDCVL